jgi:SAM-dependent methyltransferase
MGPGIDFGYPWFVSYGHLVIALPALGLLLLGRARRWPKLPMIVIGAVTLWSAAAFLVVCFGFNANGVPSLPTERFVSSGAGRVLDMGAGTGRSTLMVLAARPRASVVALDLFGDSYRVHFGSEQSGEERLLANLRAAGVADRAEVRKGDMRELPFEADTFDAIVSAYAIDHLNRDGIVKSLGEAARVVKPNGEFLLMVIGKEFWGGFAFGPLMLHPMRSAEDWAGLLRDAGFEVLEQGTRPATLYFLLHEP